MIKINKIAIVFLILMLAFPIFSFNVGATESEVQSGEYITPFQMIEICVSSNGTLYSMGNKYGSPYHDLTCYVSYDNGANWSIFQQVDGNCIGMGAMAIDSKDDLHFIYFEYTGAGELYLWRYRTYDNSEDTWADEIAWKTLTGYHWINSDGCRGADLYIDSNDNIYATFSAEESGTYDNEYVYYKWYSSSSDTWSALTNIYSGDTAVSNLFGVTICHVANKIRIAYGYQGIIREYVYDETTYTYSTSNLSNVNYNSRNPDYTVYESTIHLTYEGKTSTSDDEYAIIYMKNSGSWSSQTTIHEDILYDQYYPNLAINSDGTVNIIWVGKGYISSSYQQLKQCSYSSGSWGEVGYITTGQDNKIACRLNYQNYPTFCRLGGGISILYYNSTDDGLRYVDSGSLSWYSGGDDGYEGDFEFDANSNIGTLDTGCTMNVAGKEVEFKYQVPLTINATGFDILVSPDQHSYAGDKSTYDLFINGESMGNPTEWKAYGSNWVLRWTFADEKVITNSEILFEVWNDQLVAGYSYWYLGVSCNYEDLDGDGIATMRYSSTYPNGVFDGTWLAKDVAYQLYYNVISFVEDETPVDYNTISATNTTYYVGESVSLTYTVKSSDLVYDNYVRIWNDDTATEVTLGTMQGFPYLCTHQVETIGFVPFTSANYTAHLYINNVETDNVSFFADEHINPEMYVFSYPNPSKVGQKIWVSYKFDHPSNKSGAIFLCNSPNLNSYESVYYLSDGDSGFWTRTFDSVGIYYFIMAVDIDGNGTYGIVSNGVHPHYVRSEHGNNYFTLGGYNLRLNEEGTVTQIASGECNMVSGNVFLYDNNQLVKTITESPFSYNYEIHTAGLHTVEMRLITNVTTVLCTQNYTVTTYSGEDDIEQVEDTGNAIRDYIYDNFGDFGIFMAGVLIILGFMLIPLILVLYVNVHFHKNMDVGDIHWSLYLIFAIVGVAVTVILHIADKWLILLIVVACITIAVVIFKGSRA